MRGVLRGVKTSIVVRPAQTAREGLRHCQQMIRRLANADVPMVASVPPIGAHMQTLTDFLCGFSESTPGQARKEVTFHQEVDPPELPGTFR